MLSHTSSHFVWRTHLLGGDFDSHFTEEKAEVQRDEASRLKGGEAGFRIQVCLNLRADLFLLHQGSGERINEAASPV